MIELREPGHSAYQELGGAGIQLNSGDGAYIEVDGKFELAGLLVQGNNEGEYGSRTAYLIFDDFDRQWINSVVRQVYSEDDRDGDGVANILESALGSDLNDPASTPAKNHHLEFVRGPDGEPNTLRYHYLRLSGGSENAASYQTASLTYLGETSSDLEHWTPEGITSLQPVPPSPLLAPPGYEVACLEIPATTSKSYLRLRVLHTPNP